MTPYYQSGGIVLYLGDCRTVMAELADRSVDVVLTDPPYSEYVHAKSRRGGPEFPDAGENHASFSRVREFGFGPITPKLMRDAAREFARLARRWVLVFSDIDSCHRWRRNLRIAGLEYIRTGIWLKLGATPQFTGDRPAAGLESITIMHPKGRKRWNGGGSHAVWSVPIVLNRGGADPRLHTAQKPIGLIGRLVDLFSDPGELILDGFVGSGTTLVAARRLGRRAIGIESDERSCEVAARRLEREPEPRPLFPVAAGGGGGRQLELAEVLE